MIPGEKDFCYGDDVVIARTKGTINQGVSGKRGRVMATAGKRVQEDGTVPTDTVIVDFGPSELPMALPVTAVIKD